MADMADNLVTLIDEKWSGPAKPDIIEKVIERPDWGRFGNKDMVTIFPLGSGRHIHVTRDYYNVIYSFEIFCHTPTSSDRLKELYEEVIDILYNWYLTGVDKQRVVDQKDVSDKKTGKFKYTIHIEIEAIMVYKGAAVQSGIPSGEAGQYAPKGAEYVVLAMDDTLTNEKLHSALAGAELHNPKSHTHSHDTDLTGVSKDDHHNEDHAARHKTGGADELKLDEFGTPTDNENLNATTGHHGLLKKLLGGASKYLREDGEWATPAGGGGGAPIDAKYVVTELDETLTEEVLHSGLSGADLHNPKTHASSHQSGGGDAIKLDDLATPDDNVDLNATTGHHGLLLKLLGGSTKFLREDGTWQVPAGGGGANQVILTLMMDENDKSFTNTDYTTWTGSITYRFWRAWGYTKMKFIVMMKASYPGTVYARLYNVSESEAIAGSELSTSLSGTATTEIISGEITLSEVMEDDDRIRVEYKTTEGTGYIHAAYVLLY